eukprot:scaffold2134_cov93-Cylindrotheca_fusiformis.AAC.21
MKSIDGKQVERTTSYFPPIRMLEYGLGESLRFQRSLFCSIGQRENEPFETVASNNHQRLLAIKICCCEIPTWLAFFRVQYQDSRVS